MANQNTSGIDEILTRWREEVKSKQRRIISFEETAEIKIKSLKPWIFPERVELTGWECREFTYTRKQERIFKDEAWKPINVQETWGGPDTSAYFRNKAKMPTQFKGKKVVLKLYFGGDGLLTLNGKPYMGLDPFRDTVYLTECANGNEEYDLEVESYIFWHFGETEIKNFESSAFAVMDDEMNEIFWDFQAAYNVMTDQNLDHETSEFIKAGMKEAILHIDQNETNGEKIKENARRARSVLRKRIYASELFKKEGLLHLCGNSHLDVVFLWTHAEFIRKVGRTHANTLRLMEQYPDYIFSQSQPLLYTEMKNHFPTMYEEVKERVKEGRWEVIGAFWVEPDCNLISGESFTRQILHGIQFTEQEFGITPKTCWCPDVFGNMWTMPQILKKSGLKYFVTHKMVVWNDTNPWRKNSFWWQGPDGSRIFSVVPPTHFIGTIEPDHMATHWTNSSDQKTIKESLYNYGWGDGGGGPDSEMLEYMKRFNDFPGVTPAKPNTIEGALESMYQNAQNFDLPVHNDELYLEEHRGIPTTKGKLKKYNRQLEFLYRNAELWSSFATTDYPQDDLEKGWKILLTNQFHDSLPGSHIPPVYKDLCEAYEDAETIGKTTLGNALGNIASRLNTSGAGQPIAVFNAQPFKRTTCVKIETQERELHVVDANGNEMLSQFITDNETGKRILLVETKDLPQTGAKVFYLKEETGKLDVTPVNASASGLENDLVKLQLNCEGEILSLIDKTTGRECINAEKRGNIMKLYEDVPGKYEAWDIAPTYTDIEFDMSGAEITVVEQGPLRSAVEVSRNFFNSVMKQRIVLYKNSKRIDFETYVDWHEQQKFLKVRFFTPIITRTATYDIPFGTMERSSYRNNSFDEAKFEVPAHHWMDLSQADFGLSLINDCKYGYEAFDGMMALSLLRGPLNPDPTSDQEEHHFTYSLYPHAGTWKDGGTLEQGLDLNDPAKAIPVSPFKGELGTEHSFIQLEGKTGITLEAVKKAEKSDDLIVRVVEKTGATGHLNIKLDRDLTNATECNLLEREDTPADFDTSTIKAEIKPFEIRTFKIK